MNNSQELFDFFIPKIEDITFVQSQYYSFSSKNISVDEGINYGMGFFETILILDKPIFLREHLTRLNQSLEAFQIKIKITSDLVLEAIALCNLSHIALKLLVTESNVIFSVRPLTYTSEYYERGAKLMISNITRSSHSFLIHHKSTNYGDLILSLRNAHKLGYDDCLFFNEKGYITESAIANVFIIKDQQILTSSVSEGLLPGIIRGYLVNKYHIIEKRITIDDLVYADAVFMTNSLVGIIRVASLDINKQFIKQLRLMQLSDFIPEQVNYEPHPLIESISFNYKLDIHQS